MLIESQIPEPFIARPFVFFRAVAGGYLETMGMRLIRGRSLKRRDVERQEPNIVVNKAFVDAYFPDADPIGRRVKSSTPPKSSFPAPDWLTQAATSSGHGDGHELEVIGWATCGDECDDDAHRGVADFVVSRGARHHIFSAITMNLEDEVRRIVAADPSALNRRQSRNEINRRRCTLPC